MLIYLFFVRLSSDLLSGAVFGLQYFDQPTGLHRSFVFVGLACYKSTSTRCQMCDRRKHQQTKSSHIVVEFVFPGCSPSLGILIGNKFIKGSLMIGVAMNAMAQSYVELMKTSSNEAWWSNRTPRAQNKQRLSEPGACRCSVDSCLRPPFRRSSGRERSPAGFVRCILGKLPDGHAVAVKRLYEDNSRRIQKLIKEVQILSISYLPNLVHLYGFTSSESRDLVFVYDYVPN